MGKSRRQRFVAIFLVCATLIGSCARDEDPPTNQNSACSILSQRPGWLADLRRTEQRWGTPMHIQMAIIWRESSFRARARTQRVYVLGSIPNGHISSAYGFSQAIDGTWDWYLNDTGRRGARRDRFDDATDFVGWYTNQTRRINGIALTDAYNQYLAYHEGHGGYRRGTWREKDWLMRAARQVQTQAERYQVQLATCS